MGSIVKEFKTQFRRQLSDIRKAAVLALSMQANKDDTTALLTEVVRAAAAIEQSFSGLATRLWDDPFEWTLPEYIEREDKLNEYLDEVEACLEKGLRLIEVDDDLQRQIPAPEELSSVFKVLVDCLVESKTRLRIFENHFKQIIKAE